MDLNLKELENILEELAEKGRKAKIEKDEAIMSNLKHLYLKKEELNKEIPLGLLYRASTIYPFYISIDYYKKYKEWLID